MLINTTTRFFMTYIPKRIIACLLAVGLIAGSSAVPAAAHYDDGAGYTYGADACPSTDMRAGGIDALNVVFYGSQAYPPNVARHARHHTFHWYDVGGSKQTSRSHDTCVGYQTFQIGTNCDFCNREHARLWQMGPFQNKHRDRKGRFEVYADAHKDTLSTCGHVNAEFGSNQAREILKDDMRAGHHFAYVDRGNSQRRKQCKKFTHADGNQLWVAVFTKAD